MKRKTGRHVRPTFVGLFSGCGGFDLGFTQAGFRCLGAFDLDNEAVATHQKNMGEGAVCADVTQHYDHIVSLVSGADVLVAGPPCQGFSTIGKRALDDPRNSLLHFVADVAHAAKPKVVVVENVTGVLAPPHNRYWLQLEAQLQAAGYTCQTIKCKAVELGIPQTRVRVIMIATLSVTGFQISFPPCPLPSLRDVLTNVDSLQNHDPVILRRGSAMFEIATKILPGQKLCNVRGGPRSVHTWHIPKVFGQVTTSESALLETLMRLRRQIRVREMGDADPVSSKDLSKAFGGPCARLLNGLVKKGFVRRVDSNYDLTNSFNGKFRRLTWTDPAPTVDTRFGQPRYFLHPEEHRGLSVREAARIQGFPDTFVFSGSLEAQFRMVGNAVPPPLAATVARSLRDFGLLR